MKLWASPDSSIHDQGLDLLVPSMRLELTRLSALPPQDSVSTNSTTTARGFKMEIISRYFGIWLALEPSFDPSAAAGAACCAGVAVLLPDSCPGIAAGDGVAGTTGTAGADTTGFGASPSITPPPLPVRGLCVAM